MQEFHTTFREKSLIVDCNSKNGIDLIKLVRSQGVTYREMPKFLPGNKKFVLVVGAGMSAEREVSFMSANGIVDSLLELGYYVVFVDMGIDIANVIARIRPDVVYNALHGTYGEDGCLSGLLNILRIPYTGPGVLASSLAFNKKKSHEIFKVNKIKVPEAVIVKKSDKLKDDPIKRPYVIKPISQGSSVGIEIIFEEDDFSFADYDFPYGDEVIIEQYVKGREMQVAVLNGKAMGVLEIELLKNKRFYDYEVKYTEGFAKHLLPAPISEEAYNQVMSISEKACEIFDCLSGIIRVEYIYNEKEQEFYMLELNTHPGMTPLSICPEIVASKGLNYTGLVGEVLRGAKFEQ